MFFFVTRLTRRKNRQKQTEKKKLSVPNSSSAAKGEGSLEVWSE